MPQQKWANSVFYLNYCLKNGHPSCANFGFPSSSWNQLFIFSPENMNKNYAFLLFFLQKNFCGVFFSCVSLLLVFFSLEPSRLSVLVWIYFSGSKPKSSLFYGSERDAFIWCCSVWRDSQKGCRIQQFPVVWRSKCSWRVKILYSDCIYKVLSRFCFG